MSRVMSCHAVPDRDILSFPAKKNGDLLMRIFLTEGLKKNSYSELVFYDEKDEIFGCVYPKYGRTVIWNDTVDFIFKPPSMNQINEEYSLFIKATTDRNRFEESVKKFKVKAGYSFLELSGRKMAAQMGCVPPDCPEIF